MRVQWHAVLNGPVTLREMGRLWGRWQHPHLSVISFVSELVWAPVIRAIYYMVQVGRTALYIATQRGQTAIVEMLVEKFHANVSSRSNDGSTLMHVAALCGNADTAMAMLKKGVPLNMPNKVSSIRSKHLQITRFTRQLVAWRSW